VMVAFIDQHKGTCLNWQNVEYMCRVTPALQGDRPEQIPLFADE
jgi:hypothetical protein